ncbi:MAG: hypothetical protein K0B02_04560 [DPANN group archaeon]|nr:hypothetical protein [DPANN group archaeon]
MEVDQVKTMMRLAKESGNLRDLERLEKIMKFQTPNFRYPEKRRRSLFGNNFWETAIKNNRITPRD